MPWTFMAATSRASWSAERGAQSADRQTVFTLGTWRSALPRSALALESQSVRRFSRSAHGAPRSPWSRRADTQLGRGLQTTPQLGGHPPPPGASDAVVERGG